MTHRQTGSPTGSDIEGEQDPQGTLPLRPAIRRTPTGQAAARATGRQERPATLPAFDTDAVRRSLAAAAGAAGETRDPPEWLNDLMDRLNAIEISMAEYSTDMGAAGRRETLFTEGGTAITSYKYPKMEKPEMFDGSYHIEYSVNNWLLSFRRYMETFTGVLVDEYPKYAYTYMDKTVKAWYNTTFPTGTPTWADLKTKMRTRYLPPDHRLQVIHKYEAIQQDSSLMKYVEKFQSLHTAMIQANITREEEDLVLKFIQGLKEESDRKFLLENSPKNLEAAYQLVNKIRQARTLCKRQGYQNPPKKQGYNKLEGMEKKKAWDEGRCLGCGKPGHFIADCRNLKKTLNAMQELNGKFSPKPKHFQKPKYNGREKKVRFNNKAAEPATGSGKQAKN